MGEVIDFMRARLIRDLKRGYYIKVYEVTACRETGEWLSEPEPTGEMVSNFLWATRENTSEKTFTTTPCPDNPDVVHALVIHWTRSLQTS